jgi:hypothetical protein
VAEAFGEGLSEGAEDTEFKKSQVIFSLPIGRQVYELSLFSKETLY